MFLDDKSNIEDIKITFKKNDIIFRKKKSGYVGVTCPVPEYKGIISFKNSNYTFLPKITITHLEEEKEVLD